MGWIHRLKKFGAKIRDIAHNVWSLLLLLLMMYLDQRLRLIASAFLLRESYTTGSGEEKLPAFRHSVAFTRSNLGPPHRRSHRRHEGVRLGCHQRDWS